MNMSKEGFILAAVLCLGLFSSVHAETLTGNPDNYKAKFNELGPGDVLELEPGTYTNGFYIDDVHGTPDNWVTVRSKDPSNPATIIGRSCCNTVEIVDCSYLAIEGLKIDAQNVDVHAVSAKDGRVHSIRIEDCLIVNHGAHQQTVGISTKTPTYGWIIRGNTIIGAGTGIYLGDSNGGDAFVGGVIENNLIVDPEGYCMQIKHQNSRPSGDWFPTEKRVTIIRNNVFIKSNRPSGDGNRPNLLVGGHPESGNGSDDHYEIYGNFFYNNPRESLIQASGTVYIHDNVFAKCTGTAIYLTNHNNPLEDAYVYNNTFYDVFRAVRLAASGGRTVAVGNLCFSDVGISGNFDRNEDNLEFEISEAVNYVKNPSTVLGEMDFYPLAGKVEGSALDLSEFDDNVEFDVDFNGTSKGARTYRGAYAGSGNNPGWQLDEDHKDVSGAPAPPPPPPPPAPGGDSTPPSGTVEISGGSSTTRSTTINLDLSAADTEGTVTKMRFSNDGTNWSPEEDFATEKLWSLTGFGGDSDPGMKTIYVRFRDDADNWTTSQISAQIELLAPDAEPAPGPVSRGAFGLEALFLLLAGAILSLWRKSRPAHF